MHYEVGEPTILSFDAHDEVQAVTWAAGDMNRANPDDVDVQSAYQSALALYTAELQRNRFENEGFTLRGESADAMLAVIRRWVELGPPESKGQLIDAARTRSYKTACVIVAKTVELSEAVESNSDS